MPKNLLLNCFLGMRRLFTTLYIYISLFLMCAFSVKAQDSIRVSLLTCEPGTEIYALFGHTALRFEDPSHDIDWVFNYGVFSFNTPNFVYRFVKGETDYQLGIVPFRYFEAEYAMRGSSVYQQTLNLKADEKLRLWHLLEENYLPQNRVYRYNFFYDNCTTRARDRIEQCIDGKIEYPEAPGRLSFRDIVHQYTEGYAWEEFGIDLCLGAQADQTISDREQMFAPFYMKEAAEKAVIVSSDGTRRPLVLEEAKIVDVQPESAEPLLPFSPFVAGVVLLFVSITIAAYCLYLRRIPHWWYVLLFAVQGVAGCIIAFLFFCSVHPTVGSNWLLALLNPLPLIYLPFLIYHAVKGKNEPYHLVNFVYLTLFIILIPVLPQEFNSTILPLALSLWVASASYLIIMKKKK